MDSTQELFDSINFDQMTFKDFRILHNLLKYSIEEDNDMFTDFSEIIDSFISFSPENGEEQIDFTLLIPNMFEYLCIIFHDISDEEIKDNMDKSLDISTFIYRSEFGQRDAIKKYALEILLDQVNDVNDQRYNDYFDIYQLYDEDVYMIFCTHKKYMNIWGRFIDDFEDFDEDDIQKMYKYGIDEFKESYDNYLNNGDMF